MYPDLNILVISLLTVGALIEALVDTGVCGYILRTMKVPSANCPM
jgi:hypothetical protein